MIQPHQIEELTQKLLDALPKGLREIPQDLAQTFRSILIATFNKLDLVTREEFDAQVAVLQRTRSRLEDLEKKLAKLEQNKPFK